MMSAMGAAQGSVQHLRQGAAARINRLIEVDATPHQGAEHVWLPDGVVRRSETHGVARFRWIDAKIDEQLDQRRITGAARMRHCCGATSLCLGRDVCAVLNECAERPVALERDEDGEITE